MTRCFTLRGSAYAKFDKEKSRLALYGEELPGHHSYAGPRRYSVRGKPSNHANLGQFRLGSFISTREMEQILQRFDLFDYVKGLYCSESGQVISVDFNLPQAESGALAQERIAQLSQYLGELMTEKTQAHYDRQAQEFSKLSSMLSSTETDRSP